MNKICKSVLLATTASLVSFGIPTGAQAESIYVCKLASGFFLAATADSACVYHGSVKMTWSAVGPIGPMGPQGVAGAIGDAGPAGPAGPTGPQGNSGPAGPMGAQGLPGPKGEPGTSITGAKGDKGDRGDAGPQGVQGPAGSPSPTTGYADNGDGTVTDYSTGLMWEKKDECAGAPDLSNPHCAANAYSWSITPSNDPDGTLYTDFLTKLNSRGDGVTVSDAAAPPCFAGHCDWRIPNVFELQSILVAPYPTCGATPCIDAAFGPTQLANYWSFSTLTGASGSAWYVKFLDGNVINNSKANTFHARAVRNGR